MMRLSGSWIVFAGDSTHRQLYHSFGAAVHAVAGDSMRGLGPPTLDNDAIMDNDRQKDHDYIGWRKNGSRDGTVVSLRFLRGLDLEKLELHARDRSCVDVCTVLCVRASCAACTLGTGQPAPGGTTVRAPYVYQLRPCTVRTAAYRGSTGLEAALLLP